MSRTLESGGECGVCSDFVVNFNQTLLDDGSDFTASQGVLEPVAEEDSEGEGFAELVGTGRWTGSLEVYLV